MDLVFFLEERLKFTEYFYENARKPFCEIMLAIEEERPPFPPKYDESGEPPYLSEWIDARDGSDSVGLAALSMIVSSLKLFLDKWLRLQLDFKPDEEYRRDCKKHGWLKALYRVLEDTGICVKECPASLELIEQAILARNRIQHPDSLPLLQPKHSESDLRKYPSPYFVDPDDPLIDLFDSGLNSGSELSWWLLPKVSIDQDKFQELVAEVKEFAQWLERAYSERG